MKKKSYQKVSLPSDPPTPHPHSPTGLILSSGLPAGLCCCCSVGGGCVVGNEVGSCDVAASGWIPLHPRCLCWMRMGVGAEGAWAEGQMRGGSWRRLILNCSLISGSGSVCTPDRSSHGRSCGQAASRGWGQGEAGWCWLPVDRPGSAGARDPALAVLPLLLLQSGAQLRCTACRCWAASPGPAAGAEGPRERCGWGGVRLPSCSRADGGAFESSSYRRRRFGTLWSSLDRQTPGGEEEGREEGKEGRKREGGKGRGGATDTSRQAAQQDST